MSKETREHLSCLVDGEINRETGLFLMRRLGSDEELKAAWARYHLVRDCLRHQDGGLAADDLCARVSQALENTDGVKPAKRIPLGWLKPAAGMAVAASVALMAVVAVGPTGPGAARATGELAESAPVEPFTSPQSLTPAPYSTQASLNGQSNRQNRKMDYYLLRHYQATGAAGGKEFVTFVPIVIAGHNSRTEADSQTGEADKASEAGGEKHPQ